jgi:hypothetical protein
VWYFHTTATTIGLSVFFRKNQKMPFQQPTVSAIMALSNAFATIVICRTRSVHIPHQASLRPSHSSKFNLLPSYVGICNSNPFTGDMVVSCAPLLRIFCMSYMRLSLLGLSRSRKDLRPFWRSRSASCKFSGRVMRHLKTLPKHNPCYLTSQLAH